MLSSACLALLQEDYSGAAGGGLLAALGMGFMLFWFAVMILTVAGMWKTFEKAGKPGWAAIIPIYNVIVMLEIIGRPLWWVVLMFIPFVNLVILIVVSVALAAAFRKGAGFGVGLALLAPVFYPILGFGSASYQQPLARAA